MEKVALTTIEEIKNAVKAGNVVFCGNDGYTVVIDKYGDYSIKCTGNGHMIGLHGMEGTKYERQLNGSNFYYYKMVTVDEQPNLLDTPELIPANVMEVLNRIDAENGHDEMNDSIANEITEQLGTFGYSIDFDLSFTPINLIQLTR